MTDAAVTTHQASAYKTGITRTYAAKCSCGWRITTGTYSSADRAAAKHASQAVKV